MIAVLKDYFVQTKPTAMILMALLIGLIGFAFGASSVFFEI